MHAQHYACPEEINPRDSKQRDNSWQPVSAFALSLSLLGPLLFLEEEIERSKMKINGRVNAMR